MKFEEIFSINVNDKTEKKGSLTYLSWAWAWAEFKKVFPDANYKINNFDGTYCTGNEKIGYMVQTEVTAGDLTYAMWLPIMDMRNNAILQPKMTEINKTIMRCLTKNLAMFGLGLYIYAGEDLPESEDEHSTEIKQDKRPAQNAETVQKTAVKKEEQQTFKPITRDELLNVWGVADVEKTIKWYAEQLGVAFEQWGKEECEAVRAVLQSQKEKKKLAEQQRKAGLNSISDADLPFPKGE